MIRRSILSLPLTAAARRISALLRTTGRPQLPGAMFEKLESRQMLAADLTATASLSAFSGTSASGGLLSGSVTINNIGNAAAGAFTYRVLLSSDAIVGNEDDVVLGNQAVVSLAAGANTVGNLTLFPVPTGVNPGAYFLMVVADTTGAVTENSESNNTFITATQLITLNGATPGPNLTITNVTYTGGTFNPDQHFSVSTTIRNSGTSGSPNDFRITWVLSTDAVIGNADDIEIDAEDFSGGGGLAAGTSSILVRDMQFPIGIALGSYRLGVRVDSQDEVAETNEGDNLSVSSSANITVALPDLTGTFTYTGGTFAPGSAITGTLQIRNLTAVGSETFRVYVCLSADNVTRDASDIILASFVVSNINTPSVGLGPLGTLTIPNFSMVVPTSVAAGTYRIATVVDWTGTVGDTVGSIAETNDANNDTVSLVADVVIPAHATFGPADLRATVFPVTATLGPNGVLTFSAMITNAGGSAGTIASGFDIRAYLSTDTVRSADDTLLSSDIFDDLPEPMPTGNFYITRRLTLPSTVAAGTFFLLLDLDPNDDVSPEISESNNQATTPARSITVVRPVISMQASDAAAAEVAAPGTPNGGVFTFTRTGVTTSSLTVNITVAGTATSGSDFSTLPTTVTFAAGSASATLPVSVIDDLLGEAAETVIVSLGHGAGYDLSSTATQRSATVTITDNEPVVTISAATASLAESAGPARYTITRTGPTTSALVVNYSLAGTATAGSDYSTPTGTITIPIGSSSVVLSVPVIDDATAEPSETLIINLSADPAYGLSANAAQRTASDTITDNEPTVTIQGQIPVSEGSATAGFQFTRTGPTTSALVVNYSVSGTATDGSDYTAPSGTFTIPIGAASAVLSVPLINDAVSEPSETLILTLTADPTYNLSTNVAQRSGTVTILDNEPVVTILGQAPVSEAAPTASFQFFRTGPTTSALVVHYTLSGTTNGSDYTAPSGTITIPIGSATAVLAIPLVNDTIWEPSETLIVNITPDPAYNLSATVAQQSATVTILDNEPTVATGVTTSSQSESVGSTAFIITRTGPTTTALVVNYTLSGTTTGGSDYTIPPGSITIPIGASFATVSIPVTDDLVAEGSETLILTLAADPAYVITSTVAQQSATVTITDNEPTVTISASTATLSEAAGPARFTFTRSGPTTAALIVNYSIGGTAMAPDDYTAPTGTITIPIGASSVVLSVPVINDTLAESSETVVLTLTADPAYNLSANVAQRSATATITDNEPTVTIAATTATLAESGGNARFTFTRTGPTTAALIVNYTLGGTTDGSDYTAPTGTITIPIGATSAVLSIPVIDDTLGEGNETLIVSLTADPAYNLSTNVAQRSGTATILDNEPLVTIAAATATLSEAAGPARFTITRTGPTTSALIVNYTVAGTTDSSDYTTPTGTITIPIGAASVVLSVPITNDTVAEPTETLIINLSTDPAYGLSTNAAQRSATATITDNEPIVTIASATGTLAESAGPARFTITRTGPTTSALVVNYTVAGLSTATAGSDFTAPSGTITIPIGASSAVLNVTIIDDALAENTETLIIALAADPAYSLSATVAQRSAAANITDNEPTVTVSASDSGAAETAPGAAANNGVFTLTRTGPTTGTLVVFYSVSGTAAAGADYTALSSTVTFAIGSSTATVVVVPRADTLAESTETVILTVTSGSDYRAGPASATVNIANTPMIDLQLTFLDITGGTTFSASAPSQTLAADYTYYNNGAGTVASATISFRLSLDGIFGNADDIILGSVIVSNLLAGNPVSGSVVLNLDSVPFLPVGTYNFGAVITGPGGSLEAVPADNSLAEATQVVIGA